MDPLDPNSSKHEDAALAALLRSQWPEIPDGGFSARVVAMLPPTAATKPARWPWFACLGGGCVGALVVWFQAGSWLDFVSGIRQLGEVANVLAAALTEPHLLLGVTISALSLLMALPFMRLHLRSW